MQSIRLDKVSLVLSSVAIIIVGLSVPVQAASVFDQLYVTTHVGQANTNVDESRAQTLFDQAGLSTTVSAVDSRREGFGLGMGYNLTSNFAVEAGYLDLGQVDISFSATQAVDLTNIHPESGDGITFSGLYKYAFNDQVGVKVRLGVFDWETEYETLAGSPLQLSKDGDSGTDFYWGIGVNHRLIDELNLALEYQQFDFDNERTDYLRLGLEWYFLQD